MESLFYKYVPPLIGKSLKAWAIFSMHVSNEKLKIMNYNNHYIFKAHIQIIHSSLIRQRRLLVWAEFLNSSWTIPKPFDVTYLI